VIGIILAVSFGLLGLIGITAVYHYNRFQTLENRCDESWSNVGTELHRRHDVIPNLVRTVKGYAKHEKALFAEITKIRKGLKEKPTPEEAQTAERALGSAAGRLLAVAEAYPDLKASKSFLKLQQELVTTEDRIQAARRFYNGNVRDHRNATRQFPGTIFAAWFKPKEQDFFEVEPIRAALVEVAL
jgi:LemA protein